MKQILSLFRYGIGTVLNVLGIAGAPDDASQWNAWAREAMPFLTQPWCFVPLIMIGTSLIMFGLAEAYTRYRIDQERGDDPLLMDRDMPVRELYRYLYSGALLRSDIRDFTEWLNVADTAIRDELVQGRLFIWGRPRGDFADELTGTVMPSRLIKPEMWADMEIDSVSILDPDETKTAHTWERKGDLDYFYDLTVNRRQARRRWRPQLARIINRRRWPQ